MTNIKEFVRKISKETGYSQKDISFVLEVAESIMIDEVAHGEGVKIFKSLSVVPKITPARNCINPKTMETMRVPEKKTPKAKFSEAFKDACN